MSTTTTIDERAAALLFQKYLHATTARDRRLRTIAAERLGIAVLEDYRRAKLEPTGR